MKYLLNRRKNKTFSNDKLRKDMSFPELIQLYNHIGDEERHFNQMELDYRKLASQWLLVTFSAIGIILGNDITVPSGLSPWDLIVLICLMSSAGIFTIFVVDIKAYHGLLHEAFKQGVQLEMKYNKELPPIRLNMLLAAKDGDIINWVLFFYFFSITCLCVIANIGLYFGTYQFLPLWIHLISIVLLVLLYFKMKVPPRAIEGLEMYINDNLK